MLILLEKFRPYGIYSGGEFYVKAPFALQFVAECEKFGLAIIGIEGFMAVNDSLQPQLDMIADFSEVSSNNWQDYQRTCNQAAAKFISKLTSTPCVDNLVFNFVLTSQEK